MTRQAGDYILLPFNVCLILLGPQQAWDIDNVEELSTRSQRNVQGDPLGCRTGNGEKVSSSQAEPGQAISLAVVYFSSISCATS